MGSDLSTHPSTSVVNLSVDAVNLHGQYLVFDAVNWHGQYLVDLVNTYPMTLRDGVTKYWFDYGTFC